jgi:multidrug efflux system outer membrane protein
MLAARPDVRSAERTLEAAFYGTNAARSAFYPSITLSGSAGWTNSVGSMILNPGKFLASAVGSLTQPLFNKGQVVAQYRIARAKYFSADGTYEYNLSGSTYRPTVIAQRATITDGQSFYRNTKFN